MAHEHTQWRKLFARAGRGEIPLSQVRSWAEKRAGEQQALAAAFSHGQRRALAEEKTAGAEGMLGRVVAEGLPLLVPTALGMYFAPAGYELQGGGMGLALGALGRHAAAGLAKRLVFDELEAAKLEKLRQSGRYTKYVAEDLLQKVRGYNSAVEPVGWAGRIGGGVLGGKLTGMMFTDPAPAAAATAAASPAAQAAPLLPPVADLGGHYVGLLPEENTDAYM